MQLPATHLLPTYLLHSQLVYAVVLDQEGRCLCVNELFQKTFHLTAPLSHDFFQQSIHKEDKESWQIALWACSQNKNLVKNISIHLKDNLSNTYKKTVWELSVYQITSKQSNYFLCIALVTPATRHQTNESHIVKTKFDDFLDTLPDGVLLLNKTWKIIQANRVMEHLFGENQENIVGKSFDEFTQSRKKDKQIYPAIYPQATESPTQMVFENYVHGIEQWFLVNVYPYQEGFVVLYRNITTQKIMQNKLRDSERKLRAILNNTTDSNVLISPTYTVLSFNKVAADGVRLFMNKALQEGASMFNYILEGTREDFINNFQQAVKGEIVSIEKELFFSETFSIWFAFNYVPVYENNELIGISFNSTNIDTRKKAELRVKEQNNDLMSIAWLQSHEVRKPVANILGLVDLLKDETNSEYLQYLQQSAEELDRIVREIVSMTNTIR